MYCLGHFAWENMLNQTLTKFIPSPFNKLQGIDVKSNFFLDIKLQNHLITYNIITDSLINKHRKQWHLVVQNIKV